MGSITSEVEPVYVTTVGELVSAVTDMSDGRYVLWYRGHSQASWDVLPSIWRGYAPAEERNLTNRFRSRASIRYSPAPDYDATASWLALMQHYGLPTRLLDWTRSPLIAAYFAMAAAPPGNSRRDDEDAAIWVLHPEILNARQGFRAVTPPIDAHMCGSMLWPAFSDNAQENDKVLAVMSSETDLRMFVQQGCFTIHSSHTALNKSEGHADFLRPVVVRREHIPRMVREIDACGFRRGDLFPDLGNLAEELRRSHPPGSYVEERNPQGRGAGERAVQG